ncbi:hypothetical protein SAMD00079811_00430 [Scytonema sp. HK-05]|uniref:hypothetical protein n=1 Tax=Scytonema sp. HK-05 TaxID=1137095 RepID=UPI000935B329|nr:hypothetical protein [Scytonema sp. HK-05]OKH57433.1 hypothetical protein NIES2130_20150 [Scytonema sp. HK-05]BAY42466.1 hypothetical protein SAMD00079811_00430 [Scytonema sp. HK-05]
MYYGKYQEYKSFINIPPEIIDRKDIKKYISDDDGKNSKYLAVKELGIRCQFQNQEVGHIGVIDLPGFGDTILDTELLIKTLKQDIDFILFVRKPDSDGDDWKKSDREIYEIACRALEGFPINECSFMVLNYRKSEEKDNFKTCQRFKRTIDLQEIKVSQAVIADCSDVEEVQKHILKPVLENLTQNIHFVSEKYLESQDEVLVNLQREINEQLEKAIHLLENYSEPGERGFSHWFKEQFWKPLNGKMIDRQQELLTQQTEPHNEFSKKVDEVVKSCQTDDEGNPLSKKIIGFYNRHKSYKVAYYLCVSELRNEFVKKMNLLAQALIESERDLQLSVVKILSNDGNLKELTTHEGIEFLNEIEKQLPPNTDQLREAFQEIQKSSYASGDIILGWIGDPLAQLLPDQQIDPISEQYLNDIISKQSNQHQTLASNNQDDENSQLENSTDTPIDAPAIGSEEELNQTLASNNQDDENSQLESSTDTPIDALATGLKKELIQKIQNKIDFLRNKFVEECKKKLQTKLNYPNEQAFTKFDKFMTLAFGGEDIETEWHEFCEKKEIQDKLWHGAKQKKENQKVEEDWKTLVHDVITANRKDVLRLLKKQT